MAEPRPDFGPKGDMPPKDSKPFNDKGGDKGGKGVPLNKRSLNVRLSFSLIISCVIILLIACVCMFMFGVMVGRGLNPETQLPHLAQLLPEERPQQHAEANGTLGAPTAEEKVMQAEDLRYAQSLKGKKQQNIGPIVPVQPTPAAPQAQPAQGVQQPPATPGVQAANPAQMPPAATPVAPQAVNPAQQNFDYMFQVATFKDEESVDKLRAKLEEQGLRTRMIKDKKLIKVMVVMRGNEASAQAFRQLMVDMKLGQPLQRSKTPVKR